MSSDLARHVHMAGGSQTVCLMGLHACVISCHGFSSLAVLTTLRLTSTSD